MKSIIVVSCSNKKKDYSCIAKEMYSESVLFKKTVEYINAYYCIPYVILSSKYGIIKPDTFIHPYNKYIKNLNREEIKQLEESIYFNLYPFHKIIVFGGKEYANIIKKCCNESIIVEPLKGLGIGQRLQFLGD